MHESLSMPVDLCLQHRDTANRERRQTQAMPGCCGFAASVRLHGFERPFDPHQFGAWVVFGVFAVSFAVLYAPLHVDAAGIAVTCIYGLLASATFVSGERCMHVDPSDAGARDKREAEAKGGGSAVVTTTATPERPNYCILCSAHVKKRSKHCRRCNKCVDVFDHHCPWLNTCVGAVNYRYFLALLGSAFGLTSLQIAAYAHAAALAFGAQGDSAVLLRLAAFYGLSRVAYGCLLIATVVLLIAPWLLIVQLLTFHIALIHRGMTTYEFIVAQRNKQKLRAQQGGGADGWRQQLREWVTRNAPCLAVCELCEEDAAPAAPAAHAPARSYPARCCSSRTVRPPHAGAPPARTQQTTGGKAASITTAANERPLPDIATEPPPMIEHPPEDEPQAMVASDEAPHVAPTAPAVETAEGAPARSVLETPRKGDENAAGGAEGMADGLAASDVLLDERGSGTAHRDTDGPSAVSDKL